MALVRIPSSDISLTDATYAAACAARGVLYVATLRSRVIRRFNISTGATLSSFTLGGIGSGDRIDGSTATEGRVYWVNNSDEDAVAYAPQDNALPLRTSTFDISLPTGNWKGAANNGVTVWFLDDANDRTLAFDIATRTRDTTKDIAPGIGNWTGLVCNGPTLWFVDNSARRP